MKTATLLAAIFTLAATSAFAGDYKLDDKGKCHDDHGKFAKADMCKSVSHTYKADKKGKCRDEKGRFADKKLCHV